MTENYQYRRLLKSDPDIVDRIFEFIQSDPELLNEARQLAESEKLEQLKAAVRAEFAGRTVRIAKFQNMHERVLALFNGRNSTEVARRLNIGRSTVYTVIKQSRIKK